MCVIPELLTHADSSNTDLKDVKSTPTTPAVVMTSKGGSLADHLDLKNLPLATTPGGKAFVMKALHPSDHEIKSARVPGGNTMSLSLCSDQVTTVKLTNAAANVEVNLIPNPIEPCSMVITDGGVTTNYAFYNAAFGGSVNMNPDNASLRAIMTAFAASVEKYRITSQSVTVELIAPSLSDQGTITAAQYVMPPRTGNATTFLEGTTSANNDKFLVIPDLYLFEQPVLNDQMVLGTQAYTAKAREGVYMPLKLTTFKWRDTNDPMISFEENKEWGTNPYRVWAKDHSTGWPFYISRGAVSSLSDIAPIAKNCGSNFGFIGIAGCAKDVALRLRVRQTLEVACRPSSTYAPLLEVALPPDDLCVKMYFEVSSRMADAYPASYNDLGRLKSLIQGIAKKIGPYVEPVLNSLSVVPGPVGVVASAAKTAIPLVKQGVSMVKATRKQLRRSKKLTV